MKIKEKSKNENEEDIVIKNDYENKSTDKNKE